VIKKYKFPFDNICKFVCENAWNLLAQISTHRVTVVQIRLVFECGDHKIKNATFPHASEEINARWIPR